MSKRRKIKNWLLATLLTIGFLLSVVVCIRVVFEGTQYPGLNVRAKLIVEGNPISDRKIRIYQQGENFYGDIPVFAVLRQLGYQAEWEDEKLAVITINERTFEYRNGGLFTSGDDIDLLTPGKGKQAFSIERYKNELYTSTDSFLATMEKLGVSVDIELDIENRCIYINGSGQQTSDVTNE